MRKKEKDIRAVLCYGCRRATKKMVNVDEDLWPDHIVNNVNSMKKKIN